MKALTVIPAIVLLISIFGIVNVGGQTVAIGHVTAEVVESASAASLAITAFDIQNVSRQNALAQSDPGSWSYENLNLGEIKITSGRAVACNVVMKPASLSDSYGNNFTIDTSVADSFQAGMQQQSGSQTLHLKGRARLSDGQASGLYQGSYTMIFAYN